MSTPATGLRCVGRIDSDQLSASLFRFARQLIKECRPRRITNAFGETMVMHHSVHMQVFYRNQTELVHDHTGVLMSEITASELNPFMDTGYDMAVLAPFSTPFGKFGMLALNLCQCFLFFAEETRILDLLPIGKSSKGLETNIYTYLCGIFRQALRFALTREANIPLTGGRPGDGACLDLASYWAVVDHLDGANLGEADTIIMGDGEAALWKGEAVIASFPFKAWIAWFLSGFDTPKERLECKIYTHCYILENLRMDSLEGRMLLFQHRVCCLLSIAGKPLASLLVGGFTLLKQMVVEPATLFKRLIKQSLLFLCRIDSILKVFKHGFILYLNHTIVNRHSAPMPKPQER